MVPEEISQFFSQLRSSTQQNSSLILVSKVKPSLVLASFVHRARQCGAFSVIDLEQVSIDAAFSRLSMGSLYGTQCILLTGADRFSSREHNSFLEYLNRYEGPHTLMVWVTSWRSYGPGQLVISVPEQLDREQYQQLRECLWPGAGMNVQFESLLFQHCQTISCEVAVTLMRYQALIGRNAPAFFSEWFTNFLTPQHSLFRLSGLFFSRQAGPFLRYWAQCRQMYPKEFWVSYWSDQLMRALHFVMLVRQDGHAEAKKRVRRLPFSFIDRDWRRCSPDYLVAAHDMLWEVDDRFKHGRPEGLFLLWYYRVMSSQFSR